MFGFLDKWFGELKNISAVVLYDKIPWKTMMVFCRLTMHSLVNRNYGKYYYTK
uniref:Uncharacterized protein n=1 Tax=Arundo donax TaxID=35708 RepID=A0A0A9APE9_ARUDO